jgi:hypothetical protein
MVSADAKSAHAAKMLVPYRVHLPSGGLLHGPAFKIAVKPHLLLFDLRQHSTLFRNLLPEKLNGAARLTGTMLTRAECVKWMIRMYKARRSQPSGAAHLVGPVSRGMHTI